MVKTGPAVETGRNKRLMCILMSAASSAFPQPIYYIKSISVRVKSDVCFW